CRNSKPGGEHLQAHALQGWVPDFDIQYKVEAIARQFRALRVRTVLATTSDNVLDKIGKVAARRPTGLSSMETEPWPPLARPCATWSVMTSPTPHGGRELPRAWMTTAAGCSIVSSRWSWTIGSLTIWLWVDLTALVEPSQDRVIIYPICAACQKKAVFLGLTELETRPGD